MQTKILLWVWWLGWYASAYLDVMTRFQCLSITLMCGIKYIIFSYQTSNRDSHDAHVQFCFYFILALHSFILFVLDLVESDTIPNLNLMLCTTQAIKALRLLRQASMMGQKIKKSFFPKFHNHFSKNWILDVQSHNGTSGSWWDDGGSPSREGTWAARPWVRVVGGLGKGWSTGCISKKCSPIYWLDGSHSQLFESYQKLSPDCQQGGLQWLAPS